MEVQARHGFLPTGRQQHHLLLHGQAHHHQQAPAGEDEWWEYFPCPYCYIEVEVPFLCHHLQEEHCFDMKNAVCPICADNLGADTAGHFREQHSQQLKMRKSSSSSRAGAAAAADKEADEEDDSYFESKCSYIMGRPVPDGQSPDPLLSQFICTVAARRVAVDPEPSKAEEDDRASPSSDDQRLNQVVMDDDEAKKEVEERLRRVEFVKQMLMTTIAQD